MEKQKRILSVQDVSCFGKCSNTVALPIVNAAGHECVILPTALLSTHTAGFKGFTFLDMTDEMKKILDHWKTLDLKFDALMTGYFGSAEQLTLLSDFIKDQDIVKIIDPVMGDNGSLYSIYDAKFVAAMREFVRGADVVTPNMTEATLLCGMRYETDNYSDELFDKLYAGLRALDIKKAVITGVKFKDDVTGTVAINLEENRCAMTQTPYIDTYLHGTGDTFASTFAAVWLSGREFPDAARFATEFTYEAIERTLLGEVRYGLQYENGLGKIALYCGNSVK